MDELVTSWLLIVVLETVSVSCMAFSDEASRRVALRFINDQTEIHSTVTAKSSREVRIMTRRLRCACARARRRASFASLRVSCLEKKIITISFLLSMLCYGF